MTFQFIYYSLQNSKWKQDILVFGHPDDICCALMNGTKLTSKHGFIGTLTSLNQKFKNIHGWYLKKTQTVISVIETGPVPMSTTAAAPKPYQLIVVVKTRVGKFGAKIYETESAKSHIVSTEKVLAKLIVIEDVSKARPKIGKSGKWLNVQTLGGKKGFVNAELVALAE